MSYDGSVETPFLECGDQSPHSKIWLRQRPDVGKPVWLALILLQIALAIVGGVAKNAQAASTPQPRYIRSGGTGGIYSVVPGTWGLISIEIANPTEESVEMLSVVHFDSNAELQYGRRVWLPPDSRRVVMHPIRVPTEIPREKKSVAIRSLLMHRTEGREVLVQKSTGEMTHEGLLPVVHDRPVSAVICNPHDDRTRDVLAAMRQSRNLAIMAPRIRPESFPATPEALDGLDQLVIASDELADSPAALTSVRSWLHSGGHVWIMLDRVEPETVALLLGDAFRCEVVDRVGITHLKIEGPRTDVPIRLFEEPVEMVRLVGPDIQAMHTLDGWPVSFWQQAGRGEVLFTTLGARAWYRKREPDDPKVSKQIGPTTNLIPTPAGEVLAADLLLPRSKPKLESMAFEELGSDRISYRVVGRTAVSVVLAGFCLILSFCGALLARWGKLVWLGWIGPVLAVGSAAVLVVLGYSSRTATPPTAAFGQLVEVFPGVEDVYSTGLLSLYHPHGSVEPIGASRGGLFIPDMSGTEGSTRRMIFTDSDRWQWENLSLPAGIRQAPFSHTGPMTEPIRATATFGPDGLKGKLLMGRFQDVSDAVIATPTRSNLIAQLAPDGTFTAGESALLLSGDYLGGSLLSETQRARQEVYRRLLGDLALPPEPTFLAWASPTKVDFVLGEQMKHVGDALVSIPLEFKRPEPNSRMLIPSPLMRMETIPFPGRAELSSVFDNREGRWLEMAISTRTLLRFRGPSEVLPMDVEGATLWIKITAPGRTLKIFGLIDDKPVSLATRQSPVGLYRWDLRRRDVLELDEKGGIRLGLHIGDRSNAKDHSIQSAGWKIDNVRLQVTATHTPMKQIPR